MLKNTVYICDSKGAKKYHLVTNYRGLKPCINQIKKITQIKAQENGLTLRKLEQ